MSIKQIVEKYLLRLITAISDYTLVQFLRSAISYREHVSHDGGDRATVTDASDPKQKDFAENALMRERRDISLRDVILGTSDVNNFRRRTDYFPQIRRKFTEYEVI